MPEPDIDALLQRFRPRGPDAALREKILAPEPAANRRWPVYVCRSAIAASLLISFLLLHAAGSLDRSTAAELGPQSVTWSPEAQQMADLLGPDGNTYIALCLQADAPSPRYTTEHIPHIP